MDLLECESKQEPLRILYAIFNYVSLGQWQLARVCVHKLNEELKGATLLLEDGKSIELPTLLRNMILYPHVIWRYSVTIPSPYHLSWLCLTEYKLIVDEVDETKLPLCFEQLIEFYLLLYTVQYELKIENISKDTILSYYTTQIKHINSQTTNINEVQSLSEDTLEYLATILKSNRTIGDCVIRQLLVLDNTHSYTENNIRLFGVYVTCIDEAIELLKESSVADNNNNICSNIYGILGVFDPPAIYQSKLKVGNLFINLLQAEQFGLKRELTYNCIIGRDTPNLVRVFSEIEALQFESQYKEVDFLSKNSQLFEQRDLKWNNIFLHAFYHKTHVLQDILDRGLQFVRENDFDALSDLMKDPEWRPMSSLLLLLAWEQCKNMQSAKKLLDTLYHPQDQSSQPALFAAIQKLYYQVNLADWCIDKVRPILSTSSGSSISSNSFQQEGEIFSRLESQSILYMLHQSNSLSSSDPKEIMELLKMSPSIDDLPRAHSIPKTSSQARDIAVYRSFCAIRLTMDAILCSAQLGTLVKDDKGRNHILEILAVSKGIDRFPSGDVFTAVSQQDSIPTQPNVHFDSDKSAAPAALIVAIDGYINKILEDVKNYLQSIFPLYYRLEILENIYSLLFLKYEHLTVDGCDSEDSRNLCYTRSDVKEYLILSISRNIGYKQNIPIVSTGDSDSERSSSLTASTNSLAKERKVEPVISGFLLSRPMMEKMLQLLRDSIYDIQTSRYAMRRESTPGEQRTTDKDQSVYSSISHDTLHSRLSQLEKCINEANWRYKLVSTTEGNISSLEDSTLSCDELTVCGKWEREISFGTETQSSSDLEFSNDEDELEPGERRHSSISLGKQQTTTRALYTRSEVVFLSDKEHKGKTNSLQVKTGDSGDEGDIEDKQIFLRPKLKTSISIRKHKRKSDRQSREYSSKQNIIRKMLSSPVNLLNMCLKLGNFVSAYEVVKIFKLEGQIGAQMVHFAEKIESIGNEMAAVSKQDEEPSFDPIEIMSRENVTSEDFDKLTMSLTKNSAVMDELINILVSTNLSRIMLSGDERLLIRSGESVVLRQLVNFVPSLIILDLLCAYDISYETSRELLKNATQKLCLHKSTVVAPKLSRTSSAGAFKPLATKAFDKNFIFDNYSLSQPLIFLQTINEIIKMSGDLVLPLQLVRNGHMLKSLTPNILLTKFTDPLRPSHFVSLKKLREFQYRAVERLFRAVRSTQAVEEKELVNEMTIANITSSLNDLFKAFSTNREGILFPSNATNTILEIPQQNPNQFGVGIEGTDIGSIGEELDTLSVEFPQLNTMKYTYSYFDWFFQHLETIRSFLIKNNLQENASALSSMVLLKESPSEILAKLIFEKQMKPEMLEDLAKSIHLDVVLIMIRFTCPPLNSCSSKFKAFAFLERNSVILNPVLVPSCDSIDSVEGMIRYSENLISQAIHIIEARVQEDDIFLDYEYLSQCALHPKYTEFEESLQILQTLDLLFLASDEDKIIFYTNIVNALNIHASIRQSVLMRKRGENLSIFGVTTMLVFFTQSCYSIGQLGLVNLLDIQFKLLKVHSLDESFIASKGFRTLTYSSNKRDRFREYSLKQSDPKLVFVISNCILGNMKPKVLTKDNYKDVLTQSAVSFCSMNIEPRPQSTRDSRIVRIAEFLTWYASHFNTKRELSYEQKRDLIILNLQAFLPKSLQSITRNSLDTIPHIWRFGFFAQYEGCNLLEVSTTFHVSPFIGPESCTNSTKESLHKYSLNESSLHYIDTNSKILAKLATFVSLPNQSLGMSKAGSVSEDEKLLSLRSVSSVASSDRQSGMGHFHKIFTRNLISQSSEFEEDPSFDKNVDRILNIFSDIPVLKSYFEDSFNTLSFARKITTFTRSEMNDCSAHNQQIEMIPPLSFEQSPDGSSKPIFFNIHELFLGEKSNYSCIKTCILCLDHLIAKRRWIHAFDIVSSENFLPYRDCVWYQQIKNLILIGCINYIRRQREKSEEIENARLTASSEEAFKFLMQLTNYEVLGEIVLDIIYEWQDTQLCLNILQHAFSSLSENSNLKRKLYNQLEKIKVYSEIMNTLSKPDLNSLSNEESAKAVICPEWKHWRSIKRQTQSMPLLIVRHLSRKGEFLLAKKWAQIHEVPDPIYLHIERENILFLFSKQDSEYSTAYLILEEFTPRELCTKLCLSILESLTYPKQILFVVQFALQHLFSNLSGEELEHLRKLQIGSQALLCIDNHSVLQYTRLTDDVVLLVEQLIMNLKIQWASQVVARVTQDLNFGSQVSGTYSSLLASIDEMAFRYAELAIDLRSTNEEDLSDVSSPPIPSPNTSVFQFEPIPEHTPESTDSGESLISHTKPVAIGKNSVLPKTPMHTGNLSAPVGYLSEVRRGSAQFTETVQESMLEVGQVLVKPEAVQGIKVSRRAEWTPDNDVERCQVCRNICFGIINRKHHCRRCGKVVCRECSPHKYHVDGYQGLVRVCDFCHKTYYSKPTQETQESGLKMKGHKKASSLSSSFIERENPDALFKPRQSYFWELNKNNREKNTKLRSDFYFEQAPNADLCINIAMLHSDHDKVAKFLLDLAVKLSEKLRDVFDSTEVDCLYVVDMMKKLLNKSKLLSSMVDSTQWVNKCDLFLERISLIQSIISIQDSEIPIPSLPHLSAPEETRYLRDSLIRYSYWNLALEISTKCQLDTHSVWVSWGLSCLKDGRYDTARDKLKHCLQPVGSTPQQQVPPQHHQSLVSQIVEQIESSILSMWNSDEILHSVRKDNIQSLNTMIDAENRPVSNTHMNQLQFEEVQYYLKSYGTHKQMLEFLVKYKLVKRACLYVQSQNCSSETFREGLLIPCMKLSLWEDLKKEITANDPSLRYWRYLFKESCEYFITKRNMYYIAYELQNFIKDHVDAIKTCILFYQSQKANEPLVTYKTLHSRLHFLEEAKRHLSQAMESKTPRAKQDTKPIADLNSYLENIKLQIEVTQFFQSCQNKNLFATNLILGKPPLTQTPTLFGSPALKTKLAAEIIVAGNKITFGSELMLQIIKTFRLVPCDVFSEAVVSLLVEKRSEDLIETLLFYAKCYKITDAERDQVVINGIKEIPVANLDPEMVVRALICDKSKVEVNIQFGRLRNAYLAAVKTNMIEEVKRIRQLAIEKGDNAIKEICERYLQQHAKK